MPTQPTRPNHSPRPGWDERRPTILHRPEPPAGSTAQYVVALILMMVLVVLCIAIFFLTRSLLRGPSPVIQPANATQTALAAIVGPGSGTATPDTLTGQSQISLDPQQGYINTLVTVSGQGWWQGEPVFVFLRSQREADNAEYAYAAAVTDEQGSFQTAFTFPNELRWIDAEWAEVLARGSRSGLEADSRFTLLAPTPTNTSIPPTVPPTAPPTSTPPPTDTPHPTSTPSPVVISDWRGEYFANPALAGDPAFIRNDQVIDFLWGTDGPGEGVPADRFSARWTRQQYFQEGFYRFEVMADDGVRFWVDGELLVDDWQDGPMRPHALELQLTGGEHALQLEFYENLGDAGVQLGWEKLRLPTATPTFPASPTSPPADTPSPSPQPTETPKPTGLPIDTSTPPPPLPDTWHGEYFANPFLTGEPVLVREDPELNFDWGTDSPAEGVPADNFSARWTREVWVQAGIYRFFLEVDDGARFWIDGQLIIDVWNLASGEIHLADVELVDGLHSMQVEYFELIVDAQIHLWVEKAPP